ncbi:2,3-bisphosphoglycerate-independent phosphoglycerate mutase, partial [Myxococcota bacterium]|nr:2,3-bisphosphoglycerate-independent phosphoglycerate mutase [Myxococcota bacterium]
TDALVEAIYSGKYQYLRVNYANGDMVGHTGVFRSAAMAVEAVDLALERILKAVQRTDGVCLITADHGNADEMFMVKKGNVQCDPDGKPVPKTSHTLNQVPFILFDPRGQLTLDQQIPTPGLGNNAATVCNLLGFEAPGFYLPSLVKLHP